MIILRAKNFSKDEKAKGAALTAAGIGGGVASYKLGNSANDKFAENVLNSKLTAKDNEIIFDKLVKKAKKQGIKIEENPSLDNAMYTGNKSGKAVRNAITKYIKLLRKRGENGVAKDIVSEYQNNPITKNMGKDKIILGGGVFNNRANILSHELGHAQYFRPGRSKNLMGKTAHELLLPSTLLTTGNIEEGKGIYIGPGIAFAHGVRSGIKNERNNQEGKKNGLWNKTRSVAVPLAISAPLLIAEGKASAKGLKMMKEAGASKELLKQSRKHLGNAFGTYASFAGRNAAIGGAGEITGRGIAKLTKKKDTNE